jgi:hypothetical protein
MKRSASLLFLSVAAVALLGWMLTTPLLKINHSSASPAVADGVTPTPPPPFSVNGIMLADGVTATPLPPFSLS